MATGKAGVEKMAEAFYIRVPVDDLEQPHWRCLAAEDGGDGAIVLALRLRGLAAKCNRGGLIAKHNGQPMPLLQLSTYLGYTPQHLEHRLSLLAKHGLAEATQDDAVGGIRVVDPVLCAHFGRVGREAPPLPDKKPNQRYSRPLTQAERTRLSRTGQLPEGVYRIDVSRPMSHPAVTPAVTPVLQAADNIIDICDVTSSNSNSSSNSSSNSNSKSVTPAAAVLSDPPLLHPEIHQAISSLPPSILGNAQQVCEEEQAEPAIVLSALQLLKARLESGKIDNPGAFLRAAIQRQYSLPQDSSGQQQQALRQAEDEAWRWWQGLGEVEQKRQELGHHSRLLGVRGLTDRRKALILFRLRDELQEAA